MDPNFQQEKTKKNDTGKNILIIVLVILVILSGIKLYSDSIDKTRKSEEIILLSGENNDLNKRLDSMTYQLDLRIQEIERLGGEVSSLQEIREQLVKERSSDRKRTADEIAALNRQISSYNKTLAEKDQEIVRLREINQQLYSENEGLKTTQAQIQEEVSQLNIRQQELQEKVDIAAQLKAENIIVAAVNSRGKEREDGFRNRQIEKLKVTFNFADNKVAEAGPRDVFVQVIAPNNQPIFDIAKGSGTFNLNGKEEFFTTHRDINFTNNQQTLSFFYEKGSNYASGTHEVRIFVDNYLIGTKTFEVK
ncbi:hypothetical protein [Mongoliitalea daihaiensis]|uniref:hypothetical protein n=1 Tax=Mongoliitalea daihaiensis TaxID=2782006 RepID=UPI001F247A43|nr:hypothetical protein [Mongoliitalea daihaiensis]UJP64497.1 hypothetical protein IPZ59_17080 [Mongoliitalea daihaiensis]